MFSRIKEAKNSYMSRFKIKKKIGLKEKEIIGYFAYLSEREVYCDGDGCVIAGSKEAIR